MNARGPKLETDAQRIAAVETDVRRFRHEGVVSYVVVVVILVVALYNITQNSRILKLESSRALARCASISATITAGGHVILDGGRGDGRFQRNLEKLGYPPLKAREDAARMAARAYADDIRRSVSKITGDPEPPILADGSPDCSKLAPSR